LNNLPWLKLSLIALMIAIGIGLELAEVIDLKQMLNIARANSDHWWLILVLILLQAILFSFALAGSLFLWIVAPLYAPLTAALILATGGTLGGLSAYWIANSLTHEWLQKIETSRAYRLLQERDNLFTLFAMRVFPGFPHSIVNYSAGLLKANLVHFVVAAILGIGIKSYIYASVIHRASEQMSPQLLFDLRVIAPLAALSLISIAIVYVNGRRKHSE
jgi:uncharacterized membrane protein YdjX (TVP38/TMEM64 family)